jgi:hypothetical protein
MAATVTIRVTTGSGGSAQSAAVTGIDLISVDNPDNSAANRAANPITAGTSSFEKWIRARVDVAPDNQVNNFQLWGDGGVQSSTTLFVGKNSANTTPVSSDSTVATNDWTTYVVGTKFAWHATNMTGVASVSDHAVFQLDVDGTATAGNWTQETINYSFDES